jgi:hypothetical protein
MAHQPNALTPWGRFVIGSAPIIFPLSTAVMGINPGIAAVPEYRTISSCAVDGEEQQLSTQRVCRQVIAKGWQ